MADKGLNFLDECAAGCVNLSPQEKESTSSSWGDNKFYTPSAVVNSQSTPTKINKNDVIAKIGISVEQVILWSI